MKDKIIEILKENIGLYSEGCTDNIADGLLIESVCKDSAKEIEALFGSEMKEQNQVIEILKGHIDSLQEQLAKRDELIKLYADLDNIDNVLLNKGSMTFRDSKERVVFFNELFNKEAILRKQMNKLKAEIE